MSKIEIPFHIEGNPDFRFALVLESRSVEAHSLMDSGDNKTIILGRIRSAIEDDNMRLEHILIQLVKEWKEKHR